jgi:hypothetical protein
MVFSSSFFCILFCFCFCFCFVVVVFVWVVRSSKDRQWWWFLVFSGKVVDGYVGGPFEKEIGGRVIGFLCSGEFVYTGNNVISNWELGPFAAVNG